MHTSKKHSIIVGVGTWLLLFSFIANSAFALSPQKTISQYVHDVWLSDNGLPQNSVRSILQTHDGYLWLATEEGLARFDGIQFTVFNKQNTPGLKSNLVTSLCEDTKGTLWIGTYEGGISAYRNGEFTSYTTQEGLSSNIIRVLYVDRVGAIWIGTNDHGIDKLRNGKFTNYSTKNGLTNNSVRAIYEDHTRKLWIGTADGVSILVKGKIQPYSLKKKVEVISSLLEDHQNRMWVGTAKDGLIQIKDGVVSYFGPKQGLSNSGIASLLQDQDGNLWIGSNGGGLNRFKDGKFSAYSTKDGLSDDTVLSLLEDREHNLWVGTLAGGLNRFHDGNFTVLGTKEGLSNDLAFPIIEARDGSLWIGTMGGGLNRFKNGKFTIYNTKNGLSNNAVVSLEEAASDGSLWVGTWGGGLNQFKNGKFTIYNSKNGLTNDTIRSLYQDAEGTLWIGTNGGGLNFLKHGKFGTYRVKDGLPNDDVRFIIGGENNSLWLATSEGLSQFKDGKFTNYTNQNGLSNNLLDCLYQDRNRVLWIGTTGGGLNRFENGKFTVYNTKNGLFDDTIYRILEDQDGNLWMSSNRGVFKVSKRSLNDFAENRINEITSIAYGKEEGLRSLECTGTTQPDGCKTTKGVLWFPTAKGVAFIDPTRIQASTLPPSVYIEKVLMDNTPVMVNPNQQVIAPPGKRKFEFHYTALSFVDPGQIKFRYKLEGFDKEWVDAGTRRVAYYTSIPPGDYRFLVTATNYDGVQSETMASLNFELQPFFYQTYKFYFLLVILAIGSIVGLFYFSTTYLKKRAADLELVVKSRTVELQEANQKLAELADRDGLTGIANRRHFDEFLGREWNRALRFGNILSLIMADVDFFKDYNDHYGHVAGDQCLKQVAAVFQDSIHRPGDLAARYGGEEFVIILSFTGHEGAMIVADRIRSAVEALHIPHEKSSASRYVTISLGVATVQTGRDVLPKNLLTLADEALYEAKGAGRNQIRSRAEYHPEV